MAAQSAIYSPLAVVINDCQFRILDAWTLTMTLTTQVNPVTLTTLTTPKIPTTLTTPTTPTFIFVFAFVMVLVSVNVRPHQLVANLTPGSIICCQYYRSPHQDYKLINYILSNEIL